MNPNNQSQSGGFKGTPQQPAPSGAPLHPQPHPQTDTRSASPQQKEATINVLRSQIDSLYGDQPVAAPETVRPIQAAAPTQPQTAAQPQPVHVPGQHSAINQEILQQNLDTQNPYERTHSPEVRSHSSVNPEQWKQYHSAWQDYYQKYYAAYYDHQTSQKAAKQEALNQQLSQQLQDTKTQQPQSLNAAQYTEQPVSSDELTKMQAMQELRQRLLGKVKTRAEKVRKSRHFMPLIAALAVMLIFVFIQYNRVFIATVNAYVSPGAIDPQNIVIKPGDDAIVGEDPRLIIPKINVDVPAVYGIGPDHNSQMDAMERGVAHFGIAGANSHPGQIGNTVLSGHSSNDLFDPGDYKFIFAQLEKLQEGDTIYTHYEGVRYTYVVTKTEVVKPTQVDKLVYPTDKPILTLITCTPLGTSLNRLLVTAEQISPSPSEAKAAPDSSADTGSDSAMPGNSATLLERLFGRR